MSAKASRPSAAELAWMSYMRDRDDLGFRINPVDLVLLKEIAERWRAYDEQRKQSKKVRK